MDTLNDAPAPAALPRIDEEDVRLVTGFADVFAALVTAIGLMALAAVASPLGLFAGLVVAAAAWALSIPLVRQRNFAACAILLAVAIALGTLTACAGIYGAAGLPVAAVLWWYWRKFNVPVAGALAIAIPVVTLAFATSRPDQLALLDSGPLRLMLCGLVLFAVALWLDSGDRERRTRRADTAFWLHLMAAPLAVHGLFGLLGYTTAAAQSIAAWPVFVLVGVLALVALVIDRRPILVSSLIYLVAALGQLGRQLGAVEGLILTSLAVGCFVLVLATFWTGLRARLLPLLPAHLASRVPPAGVWAAPVAQATNSTGEDEPVRLVSSFNDIFVMMGVQAVYFAGWLGGGLTGWSRIEPLLAELKLSIGPLAPDRIASLIEQVFASLWLIVLPPAAIAWALAEYFVRRRRMALPAVVLAGDFALAAGLIGALAAAQLVPGMAAALTSGFDFVQPSRPVPGHWPALLMVAAIAAAALNAMFWWRHRVPLAIALGCAALLPLLFLDLAIAGESKTFWQAFEWDALRLRLLLGGVLVFGMAMAWDWADRARQTQRADIAFWLHMLASVMALPALFALAGPALGPTLAVYAALLVLAVVIDRRAVLVVGLPWLLSAVSHAGDGGTARLATLLLAIALMGVILQWHALRARIPGLVATAGSGEA